MAITSSRLTLLALLPLVCCGGVSSPSGDDGPPQDGRPRVAPLPSHDGVRAAPGDDGPDAPTEPDPPAEVEPGEPPPLKITYLGVGGFLIRSGDDAVLTAPLYTNPGMTDVILGDVASDPDEIDRFLTPADVADVRAILVGHGHYDHLMDVPHTWTLTPEATIYGNVSVQRLLAAFAPDQPERCDVAMPAGAPLIPREHVVALNDPAADLVDYRSCPQQHACFAARGPEPGDWVYVPNSNVRLRALCNTHPPQFGPVHFGGGCMEEDACLPPPSANGWLEGETLAFLIDFLDDEGEPLHRVYYQDAPADVPTGVAAPELIASKGVDAALLCVGTYDQLEAHPTATTEALDPRFAIGGHWEDFFRAHDEPLRAIPFMDVEPFRLSLHAALPPDENGPRAFLPDPGTAFSFPAD